MGLFSRKDKAQGAPEIPTLEDQLAAIFEEMAQDLSDRTLFGERDDFFEANMMPLFQTGVLGRMRIFRSHNQHMNPNDINEFSRDPLKPFECIKEAAEAWDYDCDSVIGHAVRAAIDQTLSMKPISPSVLFVSSSDYVDEAEAYLDNEIARIMPEIVSAIRPHFLANGSLSHSNRSAARSNAITAVRRHLILKHRKMLVNRGDREAAITWLKTEMDNPQAALRSLIGPHNREQRFRLYRDEVERIERDYKHEQAQAHFNRAAKENPASTREADLAAGRIVEIEHDDKTPIDLTGYFKSIIGQNKRYSISSKSEGRFCVISVDEEQKQAWIVAMNDADGKWLGRFRVDVGHAISHNHVFNQIAAKCGTLTVLDDLFTDLFKPLNGRFK